MVRVHLYGHFNVTRAACRHFRERAKETGVPADVALLEEIRDLLAERRGPTDVSRGAAAPDA